MLKLAEWNRSLSLDNIVKGEHSGSLVKLRKKSAAELDKLLKTMFVEFAKSFSITNNLTSDQVREIVAEIQINFYFLSLEDISLFLSQVKKGVYGVIFSLDTNKILSWLAKYEQERTDIIVQHHLSEHERNKQDVHGRTAERLSEAWNKHRQKRAFEREMEKGKKGKAN